jgi:hypothetical protein
LTDVFSRGGRGIAMTDEETEDPEELERSEETDVWLIGSSRLGTTTRLGP